jgi:hypothetical protein
MAFPASNQSLPDAWRSGMLPRSAAPANSAVTTLQAGNVDTTFALAC